MPATPRERKNLATVRRYFEALAAGAGGRTMAAFFTPDVIQEEFPNRFLINGVRRDLQAMLEAAERGRGAITGQQFHLLDAIASGDKVVVEAQWSGTLATAVKDIAAGTVMRARFAAFFEFKNGKIAAQRNYDCYDPW